MDVNTISLALLRSDHLPIPLLSPDHFFYVHKKEECKSFQHQYSFLSNRLTCDSDEASFMSHKHTTIYRKRFKYLRFMIPVN